MKKKEIQNHLSLKAVNLIKTQKFMIGTETYYLYLCQMISRFKISGGQKAEVHMVIDCVIKMRR